MNSIAFYEIYLRKKWKKPNMKGHTALYFKRYLKMLYNELIFISIFRGMIISALFRLMLKITNLSMKEHILKESFV
jgi:hypothetical protein